MTELSPHFQEIDRLGVRVVLVGNGATMFVKGFAERYGLDRLPVTVWTDPSLESYRNAGLLRSHAATFGPRSALYFVKASARGFRNGRVRGEVDQQGGTLLVDRQGRIAFYDRERAVGDHPPTEVVLEAVRGLA